MTFWKLRPRNAALYWETPHARLNVVSTRTMRNVLLSCVVSVANLICQPTCDILWNDSMSGVPLNRIRFYRDRHGILIRPANGS